MKKTSIYFIIALVLLLFVIGDLVLWIQVSSDMSKSFEEAVIVYKSYFPDFLDSRYGITLLNMAFLAIAIFLFLVAKSDQRLTTICKVCIVLSSLLQFWQIWTLM